MAAPPIAAEITAFHVVGGLLALWALVLAGIGVMREDFPGKGAGQNIVMAISALLVAGAIGTAIGTAKDEPKGGEEAGKLNKEGPEGLEEEGGTGKAPGTGANSGQQPGGENTQNAPQGGTVQTLVLKADPTALRFDKDALEATPGRVRITLQNPSSVPHNVSLEGPGGVDQEGKTVGQGGASEVDVTLKPGSYTFYCSVPGHRDAGMQGTLTVK